VETPELEHHHHHTGRPWLDLLLGVSAVSVSFISLFLAIANGRAMERLVQSNSWPFVEMGVSDTQSDGTLHFQLLIANKGVGPARIEMLEVAYNGKSMSSPREMLNAMLNRTTVPSHPRIIASNIVHGVLAAKELLYYVDFKPEDFSAEDYAAIYAGWQKLTFLVCYCSVFDECWIADSHKTRPAKVKECPPSTSTF
jgi:hypothetical protein